MFPDRGLPTIAKRKALDPAGGISSGTERRRPC
jgi:hypothetical protein